MEDRFPLRTLSEQANDPQLFPPEVHRLHEVGRVHEALAALRAHLKEERNEVRRARQQEYADNPYLWLQPAAGDTPSMYTLNGIGTMLYGHYKPDGQGHYIATQWITFVFLPIWPLSAWVVKKAETGGWYFLARAPLPPFARGARVFALAAASAVVLGMVGLAVLNATHADLLLYNGHDVPLQAVIGEQVVDVPPETAVEAGRFRANGSLAVAARRSDGTVIEEQVIDLADAAGSTIVWNMNQRGLLQLETVQYTKDGDEDSAPGEYIGATSVYVAGHVDHFFEEPPASVRLSKHSRSAQRKVLHDIATEADLRDEVLHLLAEGQGSHAANIVRAELDIRPGDRGALELTPAVLGSEQELLELSAQLREFAPDEVEVHRHYQNVRSPQWGEVASEYAALLDAHRDSPMHWYLHGRLLPSGDPRSMAAYDEALRLDPDYAYAHLARGHELLEKGEAAAAASALKRFATNADAALHVLTLRLRALRLAGGSPWNDEIAAVFTEAAAMGVRAPDLASPRTLLRASAGESLSEAEYTLLLTSLFGDDPTPSNALNTKAWLAFARRDLAEARQLAHADGAEPSARLLLLLALSGDGSEVGEVITTHADTLLTDSAEFAAMSLGAALAQRVPVPPEVAARLANTDIAPLLDPTADLSTRDKLDALIADVTPELRPAAWTIAALRLGAGPLAAQARKEAVAWGLPWEVPAW